MKKLSDLIETLKQGQQPVVRLKPQIAEQEGYAEGNMMARIVGAREHNSEILIVTLRYSEYDASNRAWESANYYNDKHVACLTAREKGLYKETEEIFVDMNDKFSEFFELMNNTEAHQTLKTQHEAEAPTVPYVEWLETQLHLAHKALLTTREILTESSKS